MLEKRYFSDLFNFTKVDNNPSEGFFDDPNGQFKGEKIFYLILFIVYITSSVIALIMFYRLRDSYIIRQRNFLLTFTGGIVAFIHCTISFLSVISNKVPCYINIYSTNVLNILTFQFFFSRSVRVILSYYYNIYKVTSLKKSKMKESYFGEKEPNSYLPKIYKKIKYIITGFIVLPTLLALTIEICIHSKLTTYCSFSNTSSSSKSEAVIGMRKGAANGNKTTPKGVPNGWNYGYFYIVVRYFHYAYIPLCVFITLMMIKVKDANKYGVKFECLSTCIIFVVFTIINEILDEYNKNKYGEHKQVRRFVNYIFTITNGGKFLYIAAPLYIIFSSIILPLIHYRRSKADKNKYFQEPLSSMQYFYKVLNTPALVNELRDIAIKEFSVENVLFWENYQLLQKMVYRYQIEYARAKAMNDERYLAQYDFEGYYQQQLMSQQVTASMDGYSYDPNMAIPRQIMPYFTSFYYTFIHYEGPASVNLSGNTVAQIQNDISIYPTVGIFDNAKNEVVEMMFTSIFPILLKNNKRHFELSLGY